MPEPRMLGRFRLLSVAGRGAAGEVYRAVDELTGATVAVKCLAGRLDDGRSQERFAREIRVLQTIANPHVVRYIDHGRAEDGRPFVAVEWLEGEDLARRQKARPLDGRGIVEVIQQAAAGLAAIHAIGVVHRDVKPSNILLTDTADGGQHVTVIDLGIAFTGAEASLTGQGIIVGTPWYMSPEQILGGEAVTTRSDIFSLGVLLFQLVTGVRPYSGDDVLAVVGKIALTDPPRLRDAFAGVPIELDAIVARAMAKHPAERFASVTAFAEALVEAPPFEPRRPSEQVDPATVVEPRSDAAQGAPMPTEERRVVTALFARFVRETDATSSLVTFDRIARQHGGSSHALLSLARVAIFGGAYSTGNEAALAARAALLISREIPAADVVIVTARTRRGVAALPDDAVERGAGSALRAGSRVRIDAPTARLLGDGFEIEGEATSLVLVAERTSSDGPRRLLGIATPCVGRDREIAQLEALYDEVSEEPIARAAIVLAGPGAGKSRVRHELLRKLSSRPASPLVLIGRGNAIAAGAPFALLGSAIRSHAGARDAEPLVDQRAKIAGIIPDAHARALLEPLCQIAGLGVRTRSAEDGVVVSDRLRAAFEQWLLDLSMTKPIVLVLEDVQWADAPSIALVDGALRNLAERPLFALAIARPEVEARFPALFRGRDPQILMLPKLTRKASEALVRHALGTEVDERLLEGIVARADGNAFYLEELIRAIADTRESGARSATAELPDTVLGTVQARLDALGAEAKRVLKAASIFGEAASVRGVAAVIGGGETEEAVENVMSKLVEKEVIERRPHRRSTDNAEFTFRHALLRDAAYELLFEEDRAQAHLRAAQWLSTHGEPDALLLANHFEIGGAPARALEHYRRASDQALCGSDFPLAVTCAEKALAAGAEGEVAGELFLLLAEAKRWGGELAGALDAASQASSRLPLGSAAWFAAMREVITAQGRLGNLAPIRPLAERVSATDARPGAAGTKIAALVMAGVHLLYNGGDVRSAQSFLRVAEELAAQGEGLDARARARIHQLRAALAPHSNDAEMGIVEQALALQQFVLAGDHRAAALTRSNMAFALLQLGALERAETTLREALFAATRLGLESVKAIVLQNLGVTLGWQGRTAEALETQAKARDLFIAHKDPRLAGVSRVHLALLFLTRGELERARHEAQAALDTGIEPVEVGARAALARVHLAAGAPSAALTDAQQAAATLERLGSVDEFDVLARLALAEALEASGETKQAHEALAVARRRLEMRRDRIGDPDLRASLIDRIPEHARVFLLTSGARSIG